MKKLFSNERIYEIYNNYQSVFNEENTFLSIKTSYFIQYNLQQFENRYKIIEKERSKIGKKYGNLNKEGGYQILPENLELAEKELSQLSEIEELIDIKTISLKDLEQEKLSLNQIHFLMFMIEEDNDEEFE